jgi:hypothetical protein
MSGKSDILELVDAVGNAMPGWRVVAPPEPFTWARDRHFRARVARECVEQAIVIRRAWRDEAYAVETYMYRAALPRIGVGTPKLLATFSMSDGSKWTVLEDVGRQTADPHNAGHRKAFLRALGTLHGQGMRLLADPGFDGGPLVRFDGEHVPYGGKRVPIEKWHKLLRDAVPSPTFSLDPSFLALPHRMMEELAMQPPTVPHGDTDTSNALLNRGEVTLIDFERASIGPASLDLGRAVALLKSPAELDEYKRTFSAAGQPLSADALGQWADLAWAYDALYWTCYFIERNLSAQPPPDSWRRDYFEPSLSRLRGLRRRRADLFTAPRDVQK